MQDEAASGSAQDAATLKADAIGFVDALVIGLAATSPAYSLAAVLGPIVALVGVYAPGVLLASFVPMLFIASAFYYLNKVDQDCGTTFSWVTRAMGPWWGWLGGWAITMTGVLVIGSLADVGVRFGFLTVGLDDLADSKLAVTVGAVALIILMTWLCVLGTELSAHVQNGLIIAQVVSLLVFAGVALAQVASGDAAAGAPSPELSWLNPFAGGGSALTGGLLLGVFAYWGWESAVNLTEETEDSVTAPGKAGILSTVILLVTYVGVALRPRRALGHRLPDRERRGGGVHLRPARHRHPRRLGLDRAVRGDHLGHRLDADDDHPGVAHCAVDGAAAGDARPVRAHPPAAPHPGRVHVVGRGHRDRLVPRRRTGQ